MRLVRLDGLELMVLLMGIENSKLKIQKGTLIFMMIMIYLILSLSSTAK
jgi:hypothetical protein